MKIAIKILAFLVITMIVSPIAGAFGATLTETAIGVGVISTFTGLMNMSSGITMMALVPDLWTGELLKAFRHKGEFLSRIPKKNQYVKYNAIHLVDLGADPAVLVNNTTYPISSSGRTDADKVLNLDKFDTENTTITDDELNNLPYDKPGSVIESHRLALEDKTAEKAIHSLCPTADSGDTPVIMTDGASNGETNARKRLTVANIIRAKRKLDDLGVPQKGRELVLCPAHVEDLLLVSQVYKEQYSKIGSGEVVNMYGFIISEFAKNPVFSNTTSQKKAFGAAASATDDLDASVFYYAPRAVQATGSATLYHAKSKDNPEYRESKVGFRLYHLCLPKKTTGFGAIVSAAV